MLSWDQLRPGVASSQLILDLKLRLQLVNSFELNFLQVMDTCDSDKVTKDNGSSSMGLNMRYSANFKMIFH